MADKQSAPHFDVSTTHAKRKKVKGVKKPDRDGATDSEGYGGPIQDVITPFGWPKCQHIDNRSTVSEIGSSAAYITNSPKMAAVALPLIGSSARPLPSPGLAFSSDHDPLLKDANQFIMEFDGDAGTAVTSIMISSSYIRFSLTGALAPLPTRRDMQRSGCSD